MDYQITCSPLRPQATNFVRNQWKHFEKKMFEIFFFTKIPAVKDINNVEVAGLDLISMKGWN